MLDENSVSKSPRNNQQQQHRGDDFADTNDDLGKLVGDTSFSDVTSDDSSGWMHKIDVTNFQRLTSNSSSSDQQQSNVNNLVQQQQSMEQPLPVYLSMPGTESITRIGDADDDSEEDEDDGERRRISNYNNQFSYGASSISSRPSSYDSRPPPMKKIRQQHQHRGRDSSTKLNDDHQISIVSSTSDAASNQYRRMRPYPKPVYSYSCMIALALKNSQNGRLQVAEIYSFMCENYPYFLNAPAGWKNSVRHNLSLNKCFEKVEVEAPGGHGRKCCLWALNPQKETKMEQEIRKYREKDPYGVREAYAHPEDMELVEQGLKGMPHKPTVVHQSTHPYARKTLPDVVQHLRVDVQQHSQPSPYTPSVGSATSGLSDSGYIGVGKSELAMKLLQQAASYSPSNWNKNMSLPQPALAPATTPVSAWPENNRHRFTPTSDQCALEFSPIHHQSYQVFSPPPFSTPIRRSTVASCHSPYSTRSQPVHAQQQHRPSSLHHFNSDIPMSTWLNSPPRPLPVFTTQHRTPERPGSCGYTWNVGVSDGMFGGGGNNHSLLVTPTNDNQQARGFGPFGGSLEAAFCAANVHNNSLLMQSMQPMVDEVRQADGGQQLIFQPLADMPSDGGLHLTSL